MASTAGAPLLETILVSYEEAAIDVDRRVGALVEGRIAIGLENAELRALSQDRHVSPRREPIAEEIMRGISSSEPSPDVDAETLIDLIKGLYSYQFLVRAPGSDAASVETTRNRAHAVTIVWDGALPR